ncbi:MAG: M56 family metallopeptidase [Bryobacteraceae bacterium]
MMAHLAASTLAAGAALAAAWALGPGPAGCSARCPARWRYALLLAALVRFALPTSWLYAAGGSLAPILPAPAGAPQAMEDLRRLLVHPGPGPAMAVHTPSTHTGAGEPSILLLLWAAGWAACVWLWARQWSHTWSHMWSAGLPAVRPPAAAESEAFLRACRTLGITRAADLRIVTADRVPGALGFWRPAVALPDALAAQLSGSELEAVLAHELAHILRRDNLWAAVAHAIVSVFWFHPLVWWIERRMLEEREIACDELVLERGTHPEVYLSGILKVCRMAFGGAEGYAGANGSSLEIRMERIMSANVVRPSQLRRAATGALVAMATLFPLAGGYLKAQPQRAADDQALSRQAQARNLFDRGKALMEQKDYDEAERAFRRSYELYPEDSQGLMGMVEVEMALGRKDEAVALLAQEAARRPERQDLQLALGNAAVRAGKYDMAISGYEKLLNSLDKNAQQRGDLYLRIGETYRRMGDLGNAIVNLRKALEIQPENTMAAITLALVLDASGQTLEAEQTYRKVLALDSNNAVALNNLAFLLAKRGGDLDRALAYAQQARQSLPEMTEVIDTLGTIYLARKSGEQAFDAFREAVLKDTANATFRNHLAQAIELKGDRSSTAEALKVALREEATQANRELVRKLLP